MGTNTRTNGDDSYRDTARRIRDELRFHRGSGCETQLREVWPRLWESIDELVGLVDRDEPRGVATPRLFDPPG